MAKIIVADDDVAMVSVLSEVLKDNHHQVMPASTMERALELVKEQVPDLVLADIEMPEGLPSGLELLKQVREFNASIPVVMITGQATKERALQALRGGAQDFIEKPFQIDELVKRVGNALFQQKAVHALEENVELKRQLQDKFRFENIVGKSPVMEGVYRMIERVANTDSTVLILGESGTGKELVAKALHYNSRRAALPFVAVNCSALPEHLLESELFGHRKGAFTGAAFDKVGLFQHADGGTIFLDEIASMAPGLQTKLLRFLQDKELRRVGDNETIKIDVRVLAATNEPLLQKIKEKGFREDLYYRISVIPVSLPPLRERGEDLDLLVAHFVQTISQQQSRPTPKIGDGVMDLFRAYRWPGNVRELQNAMERACALCDNNVIELKDLPERIVEAVAHANAPGLVTSGGAATSAAVATAPAVLSAQWSGLTLKEFIHQQEVAFIQSAIQAHGGNKEKAAEAIDISMATLYRKMTPGISPRFPITEPEPASTE